MNKIQMVDLYGQYLRMKSEIDEAIRKVIESSAFIRGPEVINLENQLSKYLNIKNVITCANGTDALQVALMALDLKPGEEVISPDFTFGATVEVIALLGLKPVLVDVDPLTFNINKELLEKAITPRTKAVIPVHLFGQCADMTSVMRIAAEHSLYVIEDTAQALGTDHISGSKRIKAGTIGTIGCTSFFPSKNLGCYGDGGAIFAGDDDLARKLSAITKHGMYVKYHQDLIGVNSRLDTMQAAILNVKLAHLDDFARRRQKAAAFYDKALSGIEWIELPSRISYSTHVFHQYTIKLKGPQREHFMNYLKSEGVPSMIYYPVPLHLQRALSYLGYRKGDFPVSESLCENVVSLPMHTELDEEQLNYIADVIKGFK
jgi:UDP-2-acetamido-2-deoxy-ribo-hexuluronate aminotransferase